jgi:hypothetical protein
MHVKWIHELCTLLTQISTYLHPCFVLVYEDLPIIPFIWAITLQNRKTCFVYFSLSGTYKESSWARISETSIFHHEKHLERLHLTRDGLRPKRAVAVRLVKVGATPTLFSPSIVCFAWFFRPRTPFALKPLYIWPAGFPRERSTERQKHQNRGCISEDWRGKHHRNLRWRDLHPLQRIPHQHHD